MVRWLAAALLGLATAAFFPTENAVHGGTVHMFVVLVASFVWKVILDICLGRVRRK
jgi:hypothetical protein